MGACRGTEHSGVRGTKAPAGTSKLCAMAWGETKGSSALRRSCQVGQSLKPVSSSGHQGLPSAASRWSPATLVHLLTHCHLPAPRRFLEASELCPEAAGAGPCLSPALFKHHVVNTEPGTMLTAGTKQTGFWPHGACAPGGQ